MKKQNPKTKYQDIINEIEKRIDSGDLKLNDQLPSVNQVIESFEVSRVTVFQAYRRLQQKGIITANHGKGYFVASKAIDKQFRIFLLFDEFSWFKEIMYNAMLRTLGEAGTVDIYFHHFKTSTYEELIERSVGNYTHYIVMPIEYKQGHKVLDTLPKNKLYLLDQGYKFYGKSYNYVCQSFSDNIYFGLMMVKEILKKYVHLNLIISIPPSPMQLMNSINDEFEEGFNRFIKEKIIKGSIYHNTDKVKVKKKHVYFTIYDGDFVKLFEQSADKGFVIGQDVGFISYNEIPIKKAMAGGLTTLSVDFDEMGETIMRTLLHQNTAKMVMPVRLTLRKTL